MVHEQERVDRCVTAHRAEGVVPWRTRDDASGMLRLGRHWSRVNGGEVDRVLKMIKRVPFREQAACILK